MADDMISVIWTNTSVLISDYHSKKISSLYSRSTLSHFNRSDLDIVYLLSI